MRHPGSTVATTASSERQRAQRPGHSALTIVHQCIEGGSRDETALSVVRGVRAPTGGYLTLRVAMSRSAYSAATAGDGFATPA